MSLPAGWAIADAVRRGETTAAQVTEHALAQTDLLIGADGIGAFLHVDGADARAQAAAVDARIRTGQGPAMPLAGVPVALKDNLAHDGQPLGCASLALRGHVASYTATAVQRLMDAGAVVIGRTNMDELAMGSSTEHSGYHTTLNPWDLDRVPGGSSGGAAAAVALGAVAIALGSDSGGSVRQPAAFCGVVGLRPTWGRVSRHGLAAFASSLDTVGPLARSVRDVATALAVMAGEDPADATSSAEPVHDYVGALSPDPGSSETALEGRTVGILMEGLGSGVSAPVKARVNAGLAALEARGVRLRPVSAPALRHAVAAYQLLSAAEASSNLARIDGVRFGSRAGDADAPYAAQIRAARTELLGPEVRRRILLGTFLLSDEDAQGLLDRARLARHRLREQLLALLQQVDALACPTAPSVAFRFGERTIDPVDMYKADVLTTPAPLAGLPAVSVPVGMADLGLGDRMPAGLQLIGRPFGEAGMLALAAAVERGIGPLPTPPRPRF